MYMETAERMNSALNEVEKWNHMMFQTERKHTAPQNEKESMSFYFKMNTIHWKH